MYKVSKVSKVSKKVSYRMSSSIEASVRLRQLAGVLSGADAEVCLAALERWGACVRGCPCPVGWEVSSDSGSGLGSGLGRCGALVWSGGWERCTWASVDRGLCLGCGSRPAAEVDLASERAAAGRVWRPRGGVRGPGLGARARKAGVDAEQVLAEMRLRGDDAAAAEEWVRGELAPRESRGRPRASAPQLCEEPAPDLFAELAGELAGGDEVETAAAKEQANEQAKQAKEQAKAAKEQAKAAKEQAKAAKEQAKAAKEQAKEQAKAAKEQAKEQAKAAKEQAKEQAKAAKEQAKEQAKAAKEQAKEQAKAAKEQAKEQAKADKQAKAQTKAAKEQAKEQEQERPVQAELQPDTFSDDEEEIDVRPFEHNGKRWLRDDAGAIYDPESHDEVGRWDEKSQSVAINA